jgi:hypothetical protein
MAYVNKRSGKNGAKRFTGLYKAVDGTYKSAGTFDTEERALEVAQATKETYARHLTLHVIPYIGKQRVAEVSRGDDPPPAHGGAEGGGRQPDDDSAHAHGPVRDAADGLG